jgi:hypothetical protein
METRSLLSLYRGILRELKSRGVIRTENAPTGDYAEYLVARGLGGVLAMNSKKSWDVQLPNGDRIQVKARVVSDPPRAGQRQLSPFRSFEFDATVVVLLRDIDFEVLRAVILPRAVVESSSVYRSHVNGYVMFATQDILDHPLAVDLTDRLRDAAAGRSAE